MKAIARFATRRPLVVLLSWLAIAVGLQVASTVWGGELRETYNLAGSDSQAAYDLLDERFPAQSGDADTVVIAVSEGTFADSAVKAAVADLTAELDAIPSVETIVGPYDALGAAQVSSDGTVAYLTVTYDASAYNIPIEDIEAVGEIAAHANGHAVGGAELTVGHGGQAASRLTNPEVGPGEMIGVAIAAVILFIAFGSFIATTVPLISAVVALAASLGILGLVAAGTPITSSGPTIAVLLGLGVGIDYALFIVNRHRLGLKAGRTVTDSVIAATTTSGRAVVFAGITVVIALAGMFVPQIAFLSGLAIAAAITVLLSVAASITLVPAMLQLYGHRVLPRRVRTRLAHEGSLAEAVPEPGRFARLVERRPWLTSIAALAVLGVLAVPALEMRLGNADQGNDPAGTPTRIAYDLVAEGFGDGANGPLVVVADLGELGPLNPAAPPAALETLLGDLASDPEIAAVLGPLPNGDGTAVIIQAIPTTSPQAVETEDLVHRVRTEYAVAAADAGLAVHVGGSVASSIDFTDALEDSLPVFFAIVIGLSVIVLTVAFRSLTLPLVGAAMNLISAAASFGIIVAVFQWGWGNELVGVGEGGPIEPFAPLILFALLFGLSMDYQVFLVSRIAELWHATGDNALAVRRGLAEVSRVIIAAASIMVVVFGSFVTSDARVMKLLGLGLAVAIFIDAFVVRVVLMPSIMRVLGRANWWMPAWLDRTLPHLEIDGEGDTRAHLMEGELEGDAPEKALTPA
jgi:RND superfamily putative drug exporter